jgi:hypothetical protein
MSVVRIAKHPVGSRDRRAEADRQHSNTVIVYPTVESPTTLQVDPTGVSGREPP